VVGVLGNGLRVPYNDLAILDFTDARLTGAITSPANNATVAGTIHMAAEVFDGVALQSARFIISNLGGYIYLPLIPVTGTSAIITQDYDSTALPISNGNQLMFAQVFNQAGAFKYSAGISIKVDNAVTDPGNLLNLKTAGHSPLTGFCKLVDVKIDSQGRVNVVGVFSGTVSFYGTSITSFADGLNIVVAQLASDLQSANWVHHYGGKYACLASSLSVDSSDNIIVTGQNTGTTNFGGSDIVSGGGVDNPDPFLVKFNSSGTHVWSKGFGGSHGNYASAIWMDSSDNIYVAGNFNFQADFGGGVRTGPPTLSMFIAKFLGTDGSWVWDRFNGVGSSYNSATEITGDASNLFVSGFTTGNVDLGNGLVTPSGNEMGFAASYKQLDGSYIWASVHQAPGSNIEATSICLDGSNVWVAGTCTQTFTLNGITFTATLSGAMYLVKLNGTTGIASAGISHGGSSSIGGYVKAFCVRADSNGNLVLCGGVTGEVDFGDGNVTAGTGGLFIVKYSPTLLVMWYDRTSGTGGVSALLQRLAINATRQIFAAGGHTGDLTIGPTTISSASNQTNDGAIMKFTP
jgi:hypothetical protein